MSSFRVKLDENLAQSHLALLERHGYDAEGVFEEQLSGVDDAALWATVRAEGRFFITLDLDFSDVRRFPPGTHPGILLLRPRSMSREAVTSILRRLLQSHSLADFEGGLVVADEAHTRIRRPPDKE